MTATLRELIHEFTTTPFLFVGSGLSRRYYDLPDWEGLLKIFARRLKNDDFIFASYENKAKTGSAKAGPYPKIAELIEKDFNERWFEDISFRQLDERFLKYVKDGISPFKVEIAMYIEKHSVLLSEYQDEVNKLKALTKKSISGIITTNYDCLLESLTDRYNVYIGQEELVFSAIQGIAEIYKIHGCITQPRSIVINEEDYIDFEQKSAYLAAKLMTIFLEYPIIFIGYSITDANIQNILKSIVNCLSIDNINRLKNRFIFVQYEQGFQGVEVEPYTINFNGKIISMTKVKLSDFKLLFTVLSEKKSALPVRILRLFKQEFYTFTLTNTPTSNLRIASIDDSRLEDEDLVLAIGKASDFGLKGLKGLTGNEWYRNIIMDDLEFNSDELLEYAYPNLIAQSNTLPLHKYLSKAKKDYPNCRQMVNGRDFEDIISNSIRKNRNKIVLSEKSVLAIWSDKSITLEKKTRLIAHLKDTEINIDDLEIILKDIFNRNFDILSTATNNERTNLRRLIRIYDYLKYNKK